MKRIKVFLASSDELKIERLDFTDLVLQLNRIFKTRDVEIELVKREHNEELKSFGVALVLYWTKFGKCELNPQKLYVFFIDAENITPELQDIESSFATDYGHFFCRFENMEVLIDNECQTELATSFDNIGLVYDSQGDYAKALEYYLKELKINEAILDKNHPNTIQSGDNITAARESENSR